MASDILLRTILIVRKETRCRHIGYSYRLTARVLLYTPSHRQDNTYHGLCYTSRGALAGTRNSSMGPTHEGSIRRPSAPWANALPLSYVPLPNGWNWLGGLARKDQSDHGRHLVGDGGGGGTCPPSTVGSERDIISYAPTPPHPPHTLFGIEKNHVFQYFRFTVIFTEIRSTMTFKIKFGTGGCTSVRLPPPPPPPKRGFALTALAVSRTKYFYSPIVKSHFFSFKWRPWIRWPCHGTCRPWMRRGSTPHSWIHAILTSSFVYGIFRFVRMSMDVIKLNACIILAE